MFWVPMGVAFVKTIRSLKNLLQIESMFYSFFIFTYLNVSVRTFSIIPRSAEWSCEVTNPQITLMAPSRIQSGELSLPIQPLLPQVKLAEKAIDLYFNVDLAKERLPKPLGPMKGSLNAQKSRETWTNNQRKYAEQALPYVNITNLRSNVSELFYLFHVQNFTLFRLNHSMMLKTNLLPISAFRQP